MSFITDRGTYCYKVMYFGLKNIGATYQRLMNRMFPKQLGKTMDVYIDDILVKSSNSNDHVAKMQECFNILNKFRMRINLSKCSFRVAPCEFLRSLVKKIGIEASSKQIAALVDMTSPRSTCEVRRLTRKIAALNRFISRSTKCLPFYQLFKLNL